ncbi:SIR2 family protein [Priestia megaterium]|uniref:SIR2 family protein n=1 Tax=Priestia megaterium TaxID=1404 RepID=UPI002FFDF942
MSFDQLVNGNKLPVLFIGSGFSRRYLNSPDWKYLLVQVYEFIGKKEIHFKTLQQKLKNRSEYRKLGEGELNAIIAEEMEREFNDYFYDSDLVNQYPNWVEEEVNPFRKCIATIVGELNILKETEEEIEVFKMLKNKVMSVITTNYDTLIEHLFELPKESTFIGQPQLFNPESLELGELFKIHGCVTEPDNIVISKTDYDNFRETAKLFTAKLLTLISENPVVFIGYSISDPNIQQILTDLVRCLSSEQIESLKNHFYLVEYNPGVQDLVEQQFIFEAKSYNGEKTVFPITIISTDNYKEIYTRLLTLTPAMNLNTVKQVKRIVKDIVIESVESKEKTDVMTILMDDISKLTQADQKFAIAIGNVKDINNAYGYNLRPIVDVLEDVLFDNKNLDHKKLVKETYENSYFRAKRILPIYKYSTSLSEAELSSCPNVVKYIECHAEKEDYLNGSIIKTIRNFPTATSMNELPPEWANNNWRKILWIIKNLDDIPLDEVQKFLQTEFSNYNSFTDNERSSFHRLVSLYDLYKYKL